MRPDLEMSDGRVRVLVTVRGWPGVQRVVVLLTGRAYAVRSFEARPAPCAESWQVDVTLQCARADVALLRARLERLPAVAAVDVAGTPPDPA